MNDPFEPFPYVAAQLTSNQRDVIISIGLHPVSAMITVGKDQAKHLADELYKLVYSEHKEAA